MDRIYHFIIWLYFEAKGTWYNRLFIVLLFLPAIGFSVFAWIVDKFGFRAVAFTIGVILGMVIASFIW